jgi:hypothetical protein
VAFERLRNFAAEGALVLPGHDGRVKEAFEEVTGTPSRYAVRLA